MSAIAAAAVDLAATARRLWLAGAVDRKFRHCDTCRRVRDDDGRALLVVRQRRSRKFECLSCWDGTR